MASGRVAAALAGRRAWAKRRAAGEVDGDRGQEIEQHVAVVVEVGADEFMRCVEADAVSLAKGELLGRKKTPISRGVPAEF